MNKYPTNIYDIAKILRKKMTPAEKLLWQRVRNNFLDVKFKRQVPFCFGSYRYIVDFCCFSKRLIIEVDGGIHNKEEIKEYDEFRQEFFIGQGYRIMRFTNAEVIDDLQAVIGKIRREMDR
ncbi:MAG: endonuclease domain-containing protein [Candidatus Falkowbacteria bacterium]